MKHNFVIGFVKTEVFISMKSLKSLNWWKSNSYFKNKKVFHPMSVISINFKEVLKSFYVYGEKTFFLMLTAT